ncbi:MAG: DUF1835 domain-containing protein [Gammaproteobacteria bacterium]
MSVLKQDILNITNGDCAVEIMKKAGITGDFLPWRDVLHEGPVTAEKSIQALSQLRIQYITEQGWGKEQDIRNSFIQRDECIESFQSYKKVILWFEHDLYDQLQLLQILDWFSEHRDSPTKLTLICTEQYLGRVSAEEMQQLFHYESPVTDQQFSLARKAWAAFCSPDPTALNTLRSIDTSALPFLQGAVLRLLEEYPDCSTGLSRSARQALEIIAEKEIQPGRLFGRSQQLEERIFMGDSSFWNILQALLELEPALLEMNDNKPLSLPVNSNQWIRITETGKDVLSGKKNWLASQHNNGRWIGGVHLQAENSWCWDARRQTLRHQT